VREGQALTPTLSRLRERGIRFAGYAAVFGHPDSGGDVIRPGAFAASLRAARDVPLLWQHKAGAVIGRVEHLSEDKRGLRVIASLGCGEEARRAARLLGAKKLDGLSFGYRVKKAGRKDGLRELVELDLVEVSLVAEPMQRRARVHAVES
jgi:HK97 family phage prohead protease